MNRKVILVSIDGMRPDGLLQCGNPFVEELMKKGAYTLEGSSVNPSVTLPCHMSIFHSVIPERHGITTNTYMPMVRPVNSLFEQISNAGGKSAMYYGWEPLRDVSRPGCLKHAEYIWAYTQDKTDRLLTESDGLEGIAWGQGIALTPSDYPTALEEHLNRIAQLRDMEPSPLLSQMQQNLDNFING